MKKYDHDYGYSRPVYGREAFWLGAKRTIYGVAAIGLAYLAMGKNDQPVDYEKDKQTATEKYDRLYAGQSPEGKYLTQYVHKIKATGGEATGGRGLIDFFSERDNSPRVFTFNNACLRNSAYDTGGGYVEGRYSGFWSSGRISGRSPAAVAIAHVDRRSPDILQIRAGNNKDEILRFSGVVEGSQLRPADEKTEDALTTHGCKTGIVREDVNYGAEDQIL